MEPLSDIRAFERIVATGNFSTAARQLGITAAAVSKRIAALEARLGVRLLTRTTRTCRTTAEGDLFYQRCREILARVDEAEAEVRQMPDMPTGLLRLAAPISFGRRKLAPLLAEFRGRYPGVKVSLTLSDVSNDLSVDEYDVALRVGLPTSGGFITRRVLSARRAVCAAPAYLARHGTPARPADLADRDCILLLRDGQALDRWMFEVDGVTEGVKVSGSLCSNSGEVVQEWALAGCGIALKTLWDVDADLADGRLVELFAEHSAERADIYALYPDRRNLPARVRALLDFLDEAMSRPANTVSSVPGG